MKKIIYFLILALLLISPAFVYAEDATSGAATTNNTTRPSKLNILPTKQAERQAKISQVQDARVNDLKARGEKEIDRRVEALNGLITRISKIKKISDSQKSELTSKVQAEIDTLTILRAKIDADTDITTLKTDVKSIVDSYRVFVVFMPQIQLLGATDRILIVSADLATFATKLETRITNAQSLGKDVAELNTLLLDLNNKLTDANSLANAINTQVLALTPEGYPANKATILDARAKLKTAMTDLKTARDDAQNIVKQLKEWGKTSEKLTATPTITP